MTADFLDAHERHWQDAEILFGQKRLANADHLYGLSAECGLKWLMVSFGMRVGSSTGAPVNAKDKKHVNDIWERYESYCSGKNAAKYPLPTTNPFGQWKISDRYTNQYKFRSYLKIVLTAKKPQKSAQTRENSPDKVPIGSVTSVYFSSMRKIAPQSICVYNGETLGHLVFLVFSCEPPRESRRLFCYSEPAYLSVLASRL